MKLYIFVKIFLVSFIECQVVLNRAQLADWLPSYATDTYIGLSYRDIQSIEAYTFSNLNDLITLELRDNQLSSLEPETFNSLTNLQRLFLNSNSLTQIETSIFSNLKRLIFLNLSDNKLISIDRQSFVGLTNLEMVNLGNNPISSILPSFVMRLCSTNSNCRINI
jgi:Leucine-rich repeat (LRR) protein